MQFFSPTEVNFDRFDLPNAKPLSGRVLLLTGHSVAAARERLMQQLTEQAQGIVLLERPTGEPNSTAIDLLRSNITGKFTAVVALGGGSTLDFAKAIAMLLVSGGQIAEYEFGDRTITGAVPLYLLPTTCGSGSEVTPYAVITNSNTGRKFTLCHPALRAKITCVDAELLQGLGQQNLIDGALDAFIHNLEALLSADGNRLIDPLARQGLQLGFQSLPATIENSSDLNLLADLALASLYGGLSISHSRTGLIHTLSVAFSEFSRESHGGLNARLLPYVLRFNQHHYARQLAAEVTTFTGRKMANDLAAVKFLNRWVMNQLGNLSISLISGAKEQREHIVDRVLQDKGLAAVNPRPFDRTLLTELVEEVLNAQA